MNRFIEQLKRGIIVFDGAMGTALQKKGLPHGMLPEAVAIEHPDWLEEVHRAHLLAGADVITTATFGANAIKLKKGGFTPEEVIPKAVACARKAIDQLGADDKERFIALDLGPIGGLMAPYGDLDFDEAYTLYAEQVKLGVSAGVDLMLIETQTDLQEARCALLATKDHTDLPVIVTMSIEESGRTFMGTDTETMATVLEGMGATAIGLNCSFGPEGLLSHIENLLSSTHLPIMVQPNAGLPTVRFGQTVYEKPDAAFLFHARTFFDRGVSIMGGCCGTTAEHIQLIRQAADQAPLVERRISHIARLASHRRVVRLAQGPLIVGERINPTGRPAMKEALKAERFDYLIEEAIRQVEEGADLLDVNIGLPGIDEVALLPRLVMELQTVVDVPLVLDSSDPKALEAALRVYQGKALINSVSGKVNSLDHILPLVKRFGASVVGLLLDDSGLPETVDERLEIARQILKKATALGVHPKDLVMDCLTLPAGAKQEQVEPTLEALERVKATYDVHTILGVSNISFGLPNREAITRTFTALAISKGLDLVIANPGQASVVETVHAARLLRGTDVDGRGFIDRYGKSNDDSSTQSETIMMTMSEAIRAGHTRAALRALDELLEEKDPLEIINDEMIPALNVVGEQYEEGKLFLPQLIRSAEVAKEIFAVLKVKMAQAGQEEGPSKKILLATVAHDVHDIGKNILKVVLENYGYTVVDLGKDVPASRILEVCRQEEIPLVGLSALMTTTVTSMQETIALIKDQLPNTRVIVGGAVLDAQYAQTIGADAYGQDPMEMVRYAEALFQQERSPSNER